MKIDFDPEAIKAMAHAMAKEHVDKMTAGDAKPDSCNINPAAAPPQPKISKEEAMNLLAQAQTVLCEKCDNHTYATRFVIKKISALISPDGQESHVPLQAFACTECNHINEAFMPKDVLDDVKERAKPKSKSEKTKAKA